MNNIMACKLKDYKCKKCGSDLFYTEKLYENDNIVGLCCSYCGEFYKWLNKDEKRLLKVGEKERNIIDAKIAELPSVTPKEKTGWIPVSEKLPEEHTCGDGFIEPSEYVLIQMRSGCMKVSRYWGSREGYKDCPWIDMRYPTTDEVIAWMSLPAPFEPQESEGKE